MFLAQGKSHFIFVLCAVDVMGKKMELVPKHIGTVMPSDNLTIHFELIIPCPH
jgi:hypothetical protein